MKLGINTGFIMKFDFEEGLRYAANLGLHFAEVGACGIAAKKFCDVEKLLADSGDRQQWIDNYAKYAIEIVSLSAHGAPLTPDKKMADEYSCQFRQCCELAEKIGVNKVTLVAGLPEGIEGGNFPVWITQQVDVPFYRNALQWQWEKRLIPYWKKHGKIAADHGVTLCFEMQVGDMINNPVKLKRFRDEIGPVVACNYDISHMWAQGIDPIEAIRYLGELVQHVHIKDTCIHEHNLRLKGFNDSTSSTLPEERAWTFTLPGWGHDEKTWREVFATLHLIGYSDILSVEMECEYVDIEEGIEKSVAFLKPLILEKPTGQRWWEAAEFGQLWKVEKEDK